MMLYIAGPMSGIEDHNLPAFAEAEAKLKAAGFHVQNPAWNEEEGKAANADYGWYIRRGLLQLLDCEGVALLPGWSGSKGATLEVGVAATIGMPVRAVEDWLSENS